MKGDPLVNINFCGGPYDGLTLSDHQVRRCTCPLRLRSRVGVRYFSLLPRPRHWAAVLAGEVLAAAAGLYPYELVLTPGKGCGAEYRDAVQSGGFDQAVRDGWVE
jgi:hypothetical protein